MCQEKEEEERGDDDDDDGGGDGGDRYRFLLGVQMVPIELTCGAIGSFAWSLHGL